MNMIFDLSSPKARARGQYICKSSALRPLYRAADRHTELIACTDEQRPDVQLDLVLDGRVTTFHGKFALASRPVHRALMRMLPNLICTYVIEHMSGAVSGATYVGSTDDFFLRWRRHLQLLRARGHKNAPLQALFDRDGPDAFTIRILKTYQSVDGLLDREVEASLPFKNLLNVRIGSQFVEGWRELANHRDEPYQPKAKRGTQTKARWYDCQGLN